MPHTPLPNHHTCEDIFHKETDKWLDIDMEGQEIRVTECEDVQYGSADRWLVSPAFDLHSTRSPEVEKMLRRAGELLRKDTATTEEVEAIDKMMIQRLSPGDAELARWRSACEAKGYLKP